MTTKVGSYLCNKNEHRFQLRIHQNYTGATSTYFRFLPYIKQNFDYGVVIFVLTFNLIAISSYQVRSVLKIARDRFYTIAIGCVVCLIMSVIVFPNWSGEDLHNSTVNRLERLAKSIED
ncbi:aluminum-activated malate transporter 12-like [Apium graveolens]|uniref:aluminum-activated malate transporter 12-like n=1 Tax=Apium graveolens TaxID=4045 RepID=UPI003D79ACF8